MHALHSAHLFEQLSPSIPHTLFSARQEPSLKGQWMQLHMSFQRCSEVAILNVIVLQNRFRRDNTVSEVKYMYSSWRDCRKWLSVEIPYMLTVDCCILCWIMCVPYPGLWLSWSHLQTRAPARQLTFHPTAIEEEGRIQFPVYGMFKGSVARDRIGLTFGASTLKPRGK